MTTRRRWSRGYGWVILLGLAGATAGAALVHRRKRKRADRPAAPPEPAVAGPPVSADPARSLTRMAVGAAIVVVLALVTVVVTRPSQDRGSATPGLALATDAARPSTSTRTWTCAGVSLGGYGEIPAPSTSFRAHDGSMPCDFVMGRTGSDDLGLDDDRGYQVVLPPARWREMLQMLAPVGTFADDGIADAVRAADPSAPLIPVTLRGSDWTSIIVDLSSATSADDAPAHAKIAGLLSILLSGPDR